MSLKYEFQIILIDGKIRISINDSYVDISIPFNIEILENNMGLTVSGQDCEFEIHHKSLYEEMELNIDNRHMYYVFFTESIKNKKCFYNGISEKFALSIIKTIIETLTKNMI